MYNENMNHARAIEFDYTNLLAMLQLLYVFVSQEQDGIAPQMFKSVIGRGHPEFSSSRQQDAEEFFMHFLSTVDRAEVCAAK